MQTGEARLLDPYEVVVVLSHYELGTIESVTRLQRGSSRSAKLGIVTERGKFLLKQRPFQHGAERIRFTQNVQRYLAQRGFPVADLVCTRTGASTVAAREGIYELFAFIAGRAYDGSTAQCREAGAMLARFHRELGDFPITADAPRGDFHDAPGVRTGLCAIRGQTRDHASDPALPRQASVPSEALHPMQAAHGYPQPMGVPFADPSPHPPIGEVDHDALILALLALYNVAAEAVDNLGFAGWPRQIIHSDWHPGNLLFRQGEVVGVVDLDSVRLSRRVVDVANGALQFSMTVSEAPPSHWPDHVDPARVAAFTGGYHALNRLLEHERNAIVPLMIESLIAECVHPIVETGSVGRWSGPEILSMVHRKATWLAAHERELQQALRE